MRRTALAFAALALAAPLAAQVEVGARERARAFAAVELEELPIERWLVDAQRLVLWLPEGFVPRGRATESSASFLDEANGWLVVVGLSDVPPGESLYQQLDRLLDALRVNGALETVESVRRMRLASRPAIEAAGRSGAAEGGNELRLVVTTDPDGTRVRSLVVRSTKPDGAPVDPLLRRILRDWAALDATSWSPSFERLRRAVAGAERSVEWDRRNRLFDQIARPEAIGAAWVGEQLAALARSGPARLVDGLLHPHPRVRIGCLEALDPLALEPPERAKLWAQAAQDPDPAVRARVARRIAAVRGLGAEVLARILDVDTDDARGAAFQLVAALDPAERAETVLSAFERRQHAPAMTRPLLVALVDRWGPEDRAEEALRAAWRRSRDPALRGAALDALLRRGHPEALAVARERLASPDGEGLPSLEAAAQALAVHSSADQEQALRDLLVALAPSASEDGRETAAEEDSPKGREESRKWLEELLEHLEAEAGGSDVECADLRARSGSHWASARADRLGCPSAPALEVARLTLPRPGAFASELLGLLGRLELGVESLDEVFHAGLGRSLGALEHWAGDPVSMTSTGVDLSAPLELAWGPASGNGADPGGAGAVTVGARVGDSQRLLDSLVRLAERPVDLDDLANGLLAVEALPAMPLALLGLWEEERARAAGEDDASSTSAKPTRYLALTVDPRGEASTDAELLELVLGETGAFRWGRTRIELRGERVVLSSGEPVSIDRERARSGRALGEGGLAWLEADLSELLRRIEERAEDEAAVGKTAEDVGPHGSGVPDGLRVAARTRVGAGEIVTRVEAAGLAEVWLALAGAGPAAAGAAPTELLPADCLGWVLWRFDPAALAELLAAESTRLREALGADGLAMLVEAAELLRGEAGLAVVGVPEPDGEDAGDIWQRHVVAYASVEPDAADRFLRRTRGRAETLGGLRFHRWEEGVVARIGRFLVVAEKPERLARLGAGPFLASDPAHRGLLERAPGDAALVAGFESGRLASALVERLAQRRDESGLVLAVEALRSLGPSSLWARRDGDRMIGEISVAPRLRDGAVAEREAALSSDAGYTSSSVATIGWPPGVAPRGPLAALELDLDLPPGAPDPGFDWTTERIESERPEPRRYRIRVRSGTTLPESSEVRLPIAERELAPFVRNERNLNLDLDELRALAEAIRGEETDPARIVRAIVDWAHDSLEYSVIRRDTSVEEILATRRADCSEFTRLTVALARSLGIPARETGGIHVGDDAAILHAWVEVYLDRWYEVDPTAGSVAISARNLRMPDLDAAFLAALPGSRFTVRSARGRDGGWARRLEPGGASARSGTAAIAVEAGRVLIDLPVVAANGSGGRRVLLSSDGGRSFAEIESGPIAGERVAWLGGHGRLLRVGVGSADAGRPGLRLAELDEAGEWRTLTLPAGLPEQPATASFGLVEDGYLALLAVPPSRIFWLDAELSRAQELALPAAEPADWQLAAWGGALARTVPELGVTVHRRAGGSWEQPVRLADTAGASVREVRVVGERIEVVVDPAEGEAAILHRLAGEDLSRRTLPAPLASDLASASAADPSGALWTIRSDRTGLFLAFEPGRP